MKKMKLIGLSLLLCGVPGAFANQISILTDYRSDGISQTSKDPAFQWGHTIANDNLYYNGFVSNLSVGNDKGFEYDLGAGFVLDYEHYQVDLGLLNNFNSDIEALDDYFFEAYVGITWLKDFSIYMTVSDDNGSFDGGKNIKAAFTHSFTTLKDWALKYWLGHTHMISALSNNNEYLWYGVGATYQWGQSKLNVELHDTTIPSSVDSDRLAQESVIISLSYDF